MAYFGCKRELFNANFSHTRLCLSMNRYCSEYQYFRSQAPEWNRSAMISACALGLAAVWTRAFLRAEAFAGTYLPNMYIGVCIQYILVCRWCGMYAVRDSHVCCRRLRGSPILYSTSVHTVHPVHHLSTVRRTTKQPPKSSEKTQKCRNNIILLCHMPHSIIDCKANLSDYHYLHRQ